MEAPKLFGRKKKAAADEPAPAEGAATDEAVVAPPTAEVEAAREPEPTAVLPTVTGTEPTPEPTPVPEPDPVPAVPEPDPVPVVPEPAPEPTPVPEPEPDPVPVVPEPDPVPAVPEPDPVPVVPEPDPEPVVPEPATAAPATTAHMAGPIEDEPVPATAAEPAATKAAPRPTPATPGATLLPKKASAKEPTAATKALTVVGRVAAVLKKPVEQADADAVPLLPPYRAAAVTGLVVGGAMVLLTWLSLRGCEAVRGTSSCGGGPGFVLLLITFVLCVYLGSALLKAFVIPDPGSSSFLAVGLVAVVSLLFLIKVITSWPMIVVIPILSVVAYLASVWVTETFVDPGPE
ncbi:hypothetical protein GCM10028801_08740 [Nocardioides maradonensis]